MTAKLQNQAAASGSLAQDADGLNYFSLPFQASCAMTTGVEVTNRQTHRTYRKCAIAPNLLLQANARLTEQIFDGAFFATQKR
jgi:hypothetical protein